VVVFHKTPTTPDIQEGVETAIESVVKQANLPFGHVDSVKIGTTVRFEVLFVGFHYLFGASKRISTT
jgi:N-methylhydantoinase A/oxoprolinase/acetone carboxylase beta subunit